MKQQQRPCNWQVLFSVILAFVFWYLTFRAKWMNFWLSMSLAILTLTLLSIYWNGLPLNKKELTLSNVLLGISSAVILYGIFWAGNFFSQIIFHFAKPEISAIYTIRNEGQAVSMALVLLFVTSPGEELFWRAFLQKWTMERFGPLSGWLLGAIIYAGVHVFSGNIMLTLAALVAGLFWGFLYWRSGSILACIISHALWTVAIFILWPIL